MVSRRPVIKPATKRTQELAINKIARKYTGRHRVEMLAWLDIANELLANKKRIRGKTERPQTIIVQQSLKPEISRKAACKIVEMACASAMDSFGIRSRKARRQIHLTIQGLALEKISREQARDAMARAAGFDLKELDRFTEKFDEQTEIYRSMLADRVRKIAEKN